MDTSIENQIDVHSSQGEKETKQTSVDPAHPLPSVVAFSPFGDDVGELSIPMAEGNGTLRAGNAFVCVLVINYWEDKQLCCDNYYIHFM